MMNALARAATVTIAALCFSAGLASAQPAAADQQDLDFAKQQAERQRTQPLNNQPVWSEVRTGAPQYTSLPGRETNVLIQPQGQTWRAMRTPIAFFGGLLLALSVGGLAVFYMIRGPMTTTPKPGDRVIQRFAPIDRYAHWLLAITWVTLAVTGLILTFGKNLLLPLIGYTLFSWLATLAKNLHNFVGPVLIVAVPLMFVRYVRYNGVSGDDVRWFTNIVGYFKGHEHPSGKFNAGEKLVFWLLLVVLTTILIVTGLILVFPNFDQTRSTMQVANIVHMIAAYLAIALACVHIYLGTIGMTGAYDAMRYGYVAESWAEHHHKKWYDEVAAGKAREKFVDPAAARGTEAAPTAQVRPA